LNLDIGPGISILKVAGASDNDTAAYILGKVGITFGL
jgi:hypothetical protein